ncbi:glucan biosynthesis protein [Phenylobacterium sp.]|uniref:glucan biosynthesis protein n=1 Tax=Phenylobacterium sp. TaxID=1871053 RepID=UPI002E3797C9|nr:glucan biosynthesis protein [Phenylobacterium sp.]HEX2559945.1 glucan biosynthesis protein [Phenylobacterium sp.]
MASRKGSLTLRRRDLLVGLAALSALPRAAAARPSRTAEAVRRKAQALARRPYAPPTAPLPPELAGLDYDGYRELRFRPERAVWRELGLPFQLQMFPRGGLHTQPVEIYEVVDGDFRPIAYSADLFTSKKLDATVLAPDAGFAGFRIHAPLNDPAWYDEFAVFLGASYFRAAPRGGVYGLSARAIEVGSGEPAEEFPAFRAFFVERPLPGATSLTVHALLDGPSLSGAYHFTIAPGEPTVFDVAATLYPRAPLSRAGIAPLTSMYLYGPGGAHAFDDFRPQVHDSDGLLLARAQGGREWRALANPPVVQISRFDEPTAGGFGLTQRQRSFEAYQDLEAHYHRRPCAWVEPQGDWGAGAVQLVELPARGEGEDNIVASWRPGAPLPAREPFAFAYRLHWSAAPAAAKPLVPVAAWRGGRGDEAPWRRFIVDFGPVEGASLSDLTADVAASAGAVRHVTLQPNPNRAGARVTFEYDPQAASVSELRARLVRTGESISESWVRRWPA